MKAREEKGWRRKKTKTKRDGEERRKERLAGRRRGERESAHSSRCSVFSSLVEKSILVVAAVQLDVPQKLITSIKILRFPPFFSIAGSNLTSFIFTPFPFGTG